MGVNLEAVIQAASDIADKEGLNEVSLKSVAEKLGIKPPSLYNHIESLQDLLRHVAHRGMKDMNQQMLQAAAGNSGGDAVKAAGAAYLSSLIAHPGVYEAIQWAVWHGNGETAGIFAAYRALFAKLIQSCGFNAEDTKEILPLIMGVLHGFCTLQLGSALAHPQQAQAELLVALDTVLLGIRQKYAQPRRRAQSNE